VRKKKRKKKIRKAPLLKDVNQELNRLEKKMFDYQGKDILSPPPFLSSAYSMGKLPNLATPYAIIEMRGYRHQYQQNIAMGKPISLWLSREMDNAKNIWNEEQFILTGIADYNNARATSVQGFNSCAQGKKDRVLLHKCATEHFTL